MHVRIRLACCDAAIVDHRERFWGSSHVELHVFCLMSRCLLAPPAAEPPPNLSRCFLQAGQRGAAGGAGTARGVGGPAGHPGTKSAGRRRRPARRLCRGGRRRGDRRRRRCLRQGQGRRRRAAAAAVGAVSRDGHEGEAARRAARGGRRHPLCEQRLLWSTRRRQWRPHGGGAGIRALTFSFDLTWRILSQ